MNLEDPNELVLETVKLFDKKGVVYALYGGLALAVYGAARETRDVDHFIDQKKIPEAIQSVLKRFSGSTISFQDVRFGGLVITRVAVVSGEGPDQDSGLNTVDLVTPRDQEYAKRAFTRVLSGPLRGQKLVLLSPEDFIIFKILSTRSADVEDAIRIYRKMKKDLDVELIEREISLLENSIPDHEVRKRWEEVKTRA